MFDLEVLRVSGDVEHTELWYPRVKQRGSSRQHGRVNEVAIILHHSDVHEQHPLILFGNDCQLETTKPHGR